MVFENDVESGEVQLNILFVSTSFTYQMLR